MGGGVTGSSSSSSSSSSRGCSSLAASSSPKSLGDLDVAGVAISWGSMAKGGEKEPEALVAPESGLS